MTHCAPSGVRVTGEIVALMPSDVWWTSSLSVLGVVVFTGRK